MRRDVWKMKCNSRGKKGVSYSPTPSPWNAIKVPLQVKKAPLPALKHGASKRGNGLFLTNARRQKGRFFFVRHADFPPPLPWRLERPHAATPRSQLWMM